MHPLNPGEIDVTVEEALRSSRIAAASVPSPPFSRNFVRAPSSPRHITSARSHAALAAAAIAADPAPAACHDSCSGALGDVHRYRVLRELRLANARQIEVQFAVADVADDVSRVDV